MQITIFGASGRVGQLVTQLALEEGWRVNVFLHKSNPFQEHKNLQLYYGDFADSDSVAAALAGSKAIISALGSWGTKQKNILSTGMATIIPLAEQQPVRRLISLTGSGAAPTERSLNGLLNHLPLHIVSPRIIKDADEHLELLKQSSLEWTVIRSPRMTDAESTAYALQREIGSVFAGISRKAVAKNLLDQVASKDHICQAPLIYKPK